MENRTGIAGKYEKGLFFSVFKTVHRTHAHASTKITHHPQPGISTRAQTENDYAVRDDSALFASRPVVGWL